MHDDPREQLEQDSSDLLYAVADLHQVVWDSAVEFDPEIDPREGFVSSIRNLAIYVAGADGPIHPKERAALDSIFWEDATDTDCEFMRQYQVENPKLIQMCLRALESSMNLHAAVKADRGEAYCAADDMIVQVVSTVCQTVMSADEESEREARRLGYLTSRLREHAITLEQKYPSPCTQAEIVTPVRAATEAESGSLEETLSELHRLTGLTSVKQEVETLANLAKVFQLRKERGLAVPPMSHHLAFLGNPGSGKTSVARIIAKLYGQLGLLEHGHLIEVDRSGLVASYVGQTAAKVQEVVTKALGGVLFIDEAYSLAGKGENDFGQEAIETLLKLMEDHRDRLIVIVAGYSEEMQEFLKSNPGLRSRFAKDLSFPDYSADEMSDIFFGMAAAAQYRLDDEAKATVRTRMNELWGRRTDSFANARDVRNLFERSIAAQANRISRTGDMSDAALSAMTSEDLPD